MKKFFTISEFARLRNININSLRYYEKIGLLKPAHIDPNTKYRYYSAGQLSTLDTILLCIDLNIPLKELVHYIDENGTLHSKRLFQEGKRVSEIRINEIQTGLQKIEYALQDLADSNTYAERQDIYNRVIRSRRFRVSEYTKDLSDTEKLEKEFADLHIQAQKENLSPIFPAGLLLQYQQHSIRCFLLSEIVNRQITNNHILEISQIEFTCLQKELHPISNLLDTVDSHFGGMEDKTVIVTNLMIDKYSVANRKSELQVTDKLFIK